MNPILIATRGSKLALAQAGAVLAQCRKDFPELIFEVKVIKTTGDKMQTAGAVAPGDASTKGLFTKELEAALLLGGADLAVHSLKDLPTDLPSGLTLGGVAGEREDARDVLVYRLDKGFAAGMKVAEFPKGMTVASGSARRKSQLLALRPDFAVVEIRGNVPTRLNKLAAQREIQGTILAKAGLNRLGIRIAASGEVEGAGVPGGLRALILEPDEMLPCVGQGAVGLEIREGDDRMAEICRRLNHFETLQCVTAERAFLRGMGGGCQTPVGAYARAAGGVIHLRAVAYLTETPQRAEGKGTLSGAAELGEQVAARMKEDGK